MRLYYDYSQEGLYFVTTGYQNKIHHFGKIENGEMVMNKPLNECLVVQLILLDFYRMILRDAYSEA